MARQNNSIALSVDMTELQKGLEAVRKEVSDNLLREAGSAAKSLENEAKQNAPWNDVTGDARRGLTGDADKDSGGVNITLTNTVPYAEALELLEGARRAIVYPTIVQNSTRTLEQLAKGAFEEGG